METAEKPVHLNPMAGTNSNTAETDGDWADLLPGVIPMQPQMGENIALRHGP